MEEEEIDETVLKNWPDCLVPGCPNKCCLRLNSPYCFPHTWTDEAVNEVLERMEQMETVSEGAFFPEFDERIHVITESEFHQATGLSKL